MSERSGSCTRCGRALKDSTSVRRGMGPVCWVASGGNVFESDLTADDQEWARREAVLLQGGEIDLGANWRYIDHDPKVALQIPRWMRISVRYRGGQFEAYGFTVFVGERDVKEIIFARSPNVRVAYAAAVTAGPQSDARAHRLMRVQARRAKGRHPRTGRGAAA
ncbi:MAG: DUF6011 domain-containing protein [bacterium]|nr:DUF6011 domain-containing protein [bacterium]